MIEPRDHRASPIVLFDLPTEIVLLLVIAAFAAGFIDSIAGGGGLFTIPACCWPASLQSMRSAPTSCRASFGSGSATITYAAKGQVDPRKQASRGWAGDQHRPALIKPVLVATVHCFDDKAACISK